jgi:hypothetical protein
LAVCWPTCASGAGCRARNSLGWATPPIADFEEGVPPWRQVVEDAATALALEADDTGRLYVAAGLLPPGAWVYCGWCIRPASEMTKEEGTP